MSSSIALKSGITAQHTHTYSRWKIKLTRIGYSILSLCEVDPDMNVARSRQPFIKRILKV